MHTLDGHFLVKNNQPYGYERYEYDYVCVQVNVPECQQADNYKGPPHLRLAYINLASHR